MIVRDVVAYLSGFIGGIGDDDHGNVVEHVHDREDESGDYDSIAEVEVEREEYVVEANQNLNDALESEWTLKDLSDLFRSLFALVGSILLFEYLGNQEEYKEVSLDEGQARHFYLAAQTMSEEPLVKHDHGYQVADYGRCDIDSHHDDEEDLLGFRCERHEAGHQDTKGDHGSLREEVQNQHHGYSAAGVVAEL